MPMQPSPMADTLGPEEPRRRNGTVIVSLPILSPHLRPTGGNSVQHQPTARARAAREGTQKLSCIAPRPRLPLLASARGAFCHRYCTGTRGGGTVAVRRSLEALWVEPAALAGPSPARQKRETGASGQSQHAE